MAERKLILAGWESYRRDVLPPTAPPIQVSECQKAFYGGAAILFKSLVESVEEGEDITEADEAMMQSVQDELMAFFTLHAPAEGSA